MKIRRSAWRHLGAVCIACWIAACGDDDGGPTAPPPDLVTFESPNLLPEGLEYDEERGLFVVGSASRGTIHTVDDAGNVAVLIADPGLATTLGIHIDRNEGLLYAAGIGDNGGAGLGVYELATGEVVRVVDLSAVNPAPVQLANDVAVDGDGNAYVTDTQGNGIYDVSPGGNAGFTSDPMLGLANGAEIYDDDVLLVARVGGPLMSIRLDEPDFLEPVETDVNVSGDGIVFTPNGDLAVVTIGGPADVILLRSDDDWQSATLVGTWNSTINTDTPPTTAAIRGDDVYVVFARLFVTGNSRYDIERVVFDPVE